MSTTLLPFVQFDYPGRLGPEDGRYLVRAAAGEAEQVLVVGGVDGLAIAMRRGRRRRGRARPADASSSPTVPVTRLTVIRPGGFAAEADAEAWLRELTADPEATEPAISEALAIVNRALHAHRVATLDANAGGVSQQLALATRLGYGTGDELADGRWTAASELPPAPESRRRAEALRPQERMAAELGRRELPDACETLLLRSRADVDAGREREAALQLRVGLEALLAEVSAGQPAGAQGDIAVQQAELQVADLAELEGRRSRTGEAANEALAGDLGPERTAEVAETLAICERVLRRRRIMSR